MPPVPVAVEVTLTTAAADRGGHTCRTAGAGRGRWSLRPPPVPAVELPTVEVVRPPPAAVAVEVTSPLPLLPSRRRDGRCRVGAAAGRARRGGDLRHRLWSPSGSRRCRRCPWWWSRGWPPAPVVAVELVELPPVPAVVVELVELEPPLPDGGCPSSSRRLPVLGRRRSRGRRRRRRRMSRGRRSARRCGGRSGRGRRRGRGARAASSMRRRCRLRSSSSRPHRWPTWCRLRRPPRRQTEAKSA